jgi:hypothetical protein
MLLLLHLVLRYLLLNLTQLRTRTCTHRNVVQGFEETHSQGLSLRPRVQDEMVCSQAYRRCPRAFRLILVTRSDNDIYNHSEFSEHVFPWFESFASLRALFEWYRTPETFKKGIETRGGPEDFLLKQC